MKKIIAKKPEEVKSNAELYMSLNEKKKEIEKELKKVKELLIKQYFEPVLDSDEEKKYKIDAEDVEVRFEFVPTTRFDVKSFKVDHPKYFKQYNKPTENKVLTVSYKEKVEGVKDDKII